MVFRDRAGCGETATQLPLGTVVLPLMGVVFICGWGLIDTPAILWRSCKLADHVHADGSRPYQWTMESGRPLQRRWAG
jgi:hypothetical protein